ncbi:AMMECR1 family [Melia azedarach]|uniref:AMMECR1 family n=1 Tax=Melia azedarach TaxID=155640 RepID=A0ACC1YA06_MELAZ|nr:AMMECR1 family [Melia azedarach]
MVSANREMAVYCFDTLVAHYNSEDAPPPAFDEGQYPLFVTWKKVVNGGEPRLRGCIGTLEARTLINGFRDYALTSALRDRRFPPIQAKELSSLECTVSILTEFEIANYHLDWEIGKHGLIIEFTDPEYNTRRSATYLPEVAAHEGWTKVEAIDSLMRKAGYSGAITESLRKRVRLTRYQSTLFTLHYSEYASYVKATRGAAPYVVGGKPSNN